MIGCYTDRYTYHCVACGARYTGDDHPCNIEENKMDDTAERLAYLRGEIDAERISYGEIAELQDLAAAGKIDASDVVLLEWAGVPEQDVRDGSYPRPAMGATCVECGRVFDLLDGTDSVEWAYGHDCEV